jgi:hypothetical protein
MSNANIIVLADAEAVPVRTLADRLRMQPVDVVKDLRGRGYRLGSIRGAAGHIGRWRSSEMTPNAISPNAGGRRAMTMHAQPLTPASAPSSGTLPRTGMPRASWERCSNSLGAEEAGAAAAGRGDGTQDRRLAEGSSAIPRPDRRRPLARRHRSHGEPRQRSRFFVLLSLWEPR